MGQARKTPRKKKETKEDVLKKEITAAVNRRATAKINEVKSLIEGLEEKVESHLKHHDEGPEHTHSNIESRLEDLERRLMNMISELRHEINNLRGSRRDADDESQPPSPF